MYNSEKDKIVECFYNIKDERDRSEVMASLMSEMNNSMHLDKKELIRQLNTKHKTLQQLLFGFFLKWCHYLAGLDDDKPDVDGRNEASVKVAKKIMEALDNCTGLPLV